MNEFLQKIMLFINEHTLLLIGICVFLILVLIGYLIDNSVKSKRVRKDIKNADQVPDNIKDEIIKQAEIKNNAKEDMNVSLENNQNVDQNSSIKVENNVEPLKLDDNQNVQDMNSGLDLNASLQQEPINSLNLDDNQNVQDMNSGLDLNASLQQEPTNTLNLDDNQNVQDMNSGLDLNASLQQEPINSLNLENSQSNQDMMFNLDLNISPKSDNVEVDPDAYLMNETKQEPNYLNDKKLSEILYGVNNNSNINQNIQQPNISKESQQENIVINQDVNVNGVQIENNSDSDELDRIMKKLSSMNSNTQDDNYTNIF